MTSYAVATLRSVNLNADVVAYLEQIDETLKPYDGRFLIHGGEKHVMEGRADYDLIVLSFPSFHSARDWYNSPQYQSILKLRTDNSVGDVFLIEGVSLHHKATDILGG